MNILALDLGTSTGFAWNKGDEFFCGTWRLSALKEVRQWGRERKTRTDDPRIERLCTHIGALGEFDIVVFEDIQFASYTYQVQLWSSLRAAAWLCAHTSRFECVPVATLKKFATGNGAADKGGMSDFLKVRHPEIWKPTMDDNAVDAAWIWLWSKLTFARMKT